MNDNKKIKQSVGSRAFDWINYIFLALFSITILFPFWNLFVQSISSPDAGIVDALQMWPKKFSSFNYKYVLSNRYIWTGYRETLIRTIAGTALSVTLTAMGGLCPFQKKSAQPEFLDDGSAGTHVFFRRYDSQLFMDGKPASDRQPSCIDTAGTGKLL